MDSEDSDCDTLGSGTDGTVIKINDHIVEKHYAEKCIEYSMLREIDFYAKIQKLKLPFVKTYSWGLNSDNIYYLRMKRYDMTLDKYIQETRDNIRHVVDVAYHMTCDLLHTLDFLHNNNVMHRDIKASNVLMCSSKDKFILADMCRCGYLDYTRTTNMTTEYCAAPEVGTDKFNEGFYSDMYSLGDLIGRTLCLISSYERVDDWNLEMKKFKSNYNGNDYGLTDLVLKLTDHDTNKRPSVKECAMLLNIDLAHPVFFKYLPKSNYNNIPLSSYYLLLDFSNIMAVIHIIDEHIIEFSMDMISRCITNGLDTKFSIDRIVLACLFLVVKTRSDYGYDFKSLYKLVNNKYQKLYTSELEHIIWTSLGGIVNAHSSEHVHEMFSKYIELKTIKRQKCY
jgi:serine/threonine protein kinase